MNQPITRWHETFHVVKKVGKLYVVEEVEEVGFTAVDKLPLTPGLYFAKLVKRQPSSKPGDVFLINDGPLLVSRQPVDCDGFPFPRDYGGFVEVECLSLRDFVERLRRPRPLVLYTGQPYVTKPGFYLAHVVEPEALRRLLREAVSNGVPLVAS